MIVSKREWCFFPIERITVGEFVEMMFFEGRMKRFTKECLFFSQVVPNFQKPPRDVSLDLVSVV